MAGLLFFSPVPVAQTPDGRHAIALCFFVPGYAAVIFGCSCWVKAKNWPDAVLLIGLAPLAILLVPYVRLIYRAAPMLLPNPVCRNANIGTGDERLLWAQARFVSPLQGDVR